MSKKLIILITILISILLAVRFGGRFALTKMIGSQKNMTQSGINVLNGKFGFILGGKFVAVKGPQGQFTGKWRFVKTQFI